MEWELLKIVFNNKIGDKEEPTTIRFDILIIKVNISKFFKAPSHYMVFLNYSSSLLPNSNVLK